MEVRFGDPTTGERSVIQHWNYIQIFPNRIESSNGDGCQVIALRSFEGQWVDPDTSRHWETVEFLFDDAPDGWRERWGR